jgi:hypothetical protein
MRNLINEQLTAWSEIKSNWMHNQGNVNTYLNLNVIPYDQLQNGNYQLSMNYDMLLPPLQVLGNIDDNNLNKLLIVSLEPLKTDRDLNQQYNYFFQTPENYIINEEYGSHQLRQEQYINYQTRYFDVFPKMLGIDSPYVPGSNIYWRYIDHIANGYSGNNHHRSINWGTLRDYILDIPIAPLWARSHPGFQINNHLLRDLFIQKINILKPKKILVLGKSKFELVMNYMGLEPLHFEDTIQNGNYEITIYRRDYEWGECSLYFRRFFSNGGGSYLDAFNAGNIIANS